MRALVAAIIACWTFSSAGTALATPTAQQKCDFARITAWKVYQACVDTVVAKNAKVGFSFDLFAASAKCRHAYFKKWTAFQSNTSLATSSCIGVRLADNGATVTDNLTGLVWEKKTNDSTVHDEGNRYTWSTGSNNEDGTTFTSFLTTGLNTPGFAGSNGWRLPTFAELQTTVLDYACRGAGAAPTCRCGSRPCIDAMFGPTQSSNYWSATSLVPGPNDPWLVDYFFGDVGTIAKTTLSYVRAVRGGF